MNLPLFPVSPLQAMDYLGVAVFAASGVLVIATVTAVGGGTLRDLLIDRPVFWLTSTVYLWVILAATLATMLLVRVREIPLRALLIADALGLALFAVSGARIAEAAGYGGIVVVILGTMTGVAGGVLRDLLLAEIPLLLRNGELYATAALSGLVVYMLLQMAGVERIIAGYAGMTVIVALRCIAIFTSLRVPVLIIGDSVKRGK